MPLIIGMNISPLSSESRGLAAQKHGDWRNKLSNMLET
jgi:hypothetical protein